MGEAVGEAVWWRRGRAMKAAVVGDDCLYFFNYTRFAWAGGTFFPVVLLCQFLVLAGNRFWCYILMYLEYNTVVVLC